MGMGSQVLRSEGARLAVARRLSCPTSGGHTGPMWWPGRVRVQKEGKERAPCAVLCAVHLIFGCIYGCTRLVLYSLRALNTTPPQAHVEFVGGQGDRKMAIAHPISQGKAHLEAVTPDENGCGAVEARPSHPRRTTIMKRKC